MNKIYSVPFFLMILISCKKLDNCDRNFNKNNIPLLTKICFGSCGREWKPEPLLYKIIEQHPQLFIYLGDNIYGDSEDMKVLEKKYFKLCCKAEFQELIQSCRVLATWDDHDFGKNDGGKEYPQKEASKNLFMKFWGETDNTERMSHTGIYTSYNFGDSAHLVQVILLDLRTFRDLLTKDNNGNYIANNDSAITMLGDVQWNWLKQELLKPAKIRIIGSSTQFARSYNGIEAWANFPKEQERMFQTIRETRANGLFFISGDLHLADLSKRNEPGLYPVYDFTSSGITEYQNVDIPNTNRIGEVVYNQPNFGEIEIDWNEPVKINFKIGVALGSEKLNKTIYLRDITF